MVMQQYPRGENHHVLGGVHPAKSALQQECLVIMWSNIIKCHLKLNQSQKTSCIHVFSLYHYIR